MRYKFLPDGCVISITANQNDIKDVWAAIRQRQRHEKGWMPAEIQLPCTVTGDGISDDPNNRAASIVIDIPNGLPGVRHLVISRLVDIDYFGFNPPYECPGLKYNEINWVDALAKHEFDLLCAERRSQWAEYRVRYSGELVEAAKNGIGALNVAERNLEEAKKQDADARECLKCLKYKTPNA